MAAEREAGAQAGSEALENALVDLGRAVQCPLAIGSHVREHISAHPLPWFAAVLAGVGWAAAPRWTLKTGQ